MIGKCRLCRDKKVKYEFYYFSLGSTVVITLCALADYNRQCVHMIVEGKHNHLGSITSELTNPVSGKAANLESCFWRETRIT